MSLQKKPAFKALKKHAQDIQSIHLRDLLKDAGRAAALRFEADGVLLDCARQNATKETLPLLLELAAEVGLNEKMTAMAAGQKINRTENRSVMHIALRAAATSTYLVDGENVVPSVHAVLQQIKAFSEKVRREKFLGATGKPLTQVLAIGIGGSYLGPEFVAEALRTDVACAKAATGRSLRFLANVDPIDVTRALEGLDPEQTLVVVVSKTFTTAETMLNATTVKNWLVKKLGKTAPAQHMVAVSTNLPAVEAFGINPSNAFGFWDWVGGRYSVCAAVGVLPLALQYGFKNVERFLAGARSMDDHFLSAPLNKNLPVILGLFGVWNSTFLGHASRALLPYCQALLKLAPHIQQVDMESNGKSVDINGKALGFEAGEIDFGEPGTNGQHSFYQLLHQGRVVPADFIGFRVSQTPIKVPGHPVSNHDELMANFFAQPDALALGKTAEEVAAEGVPANVVSSKVFSGNRPSNVLLLEKLDAESCGQLLALYEHRTAVQGFIWNLNSFDQMGVELGKVLAKRVVGQLAASRKSGEAVSGFNPSTTALLEKYLEKS